MDDWNIYKVYLDFSFIHLKGTQEAIPTSIIAISNLRDASHSSNALTAYPL
jgi:hypothetical protein